MSINPGTQFGRWTVIGRAKDRPIGKTGKRFPYWKCRCSCGTVRDVQQNGLTTGNSSSCGCGNREASRSAHTKHGQAGTPTYAIWSAMKARCENERNPRFADYGGRGITVCSDWSASFEAFLSSMGPRPSALHTLERERNDEGYGPQNCRWATQPEQAINRRTTRLIETPEGPVPLSVLARRCDVPANTLNARIKAGWSLARAMSEPARSKMPNGAGRARDRI